MPSSATPFLLPGNAWGQEDSLSSVASNDSGLSIPDNISTTSSPLRPSSIRSNISATSSRSATRDSTIGSSSASRNNSASGNSSDTTNGSSSHNSNIGATRNSATRNISATNSISASNNSSATNPLRRNRMDAMHLHPPRNPNVRESDARVRNRMQTLAAPVEHHPRRSTPHTRQEEPLRQGAEENSEQCVWITVLVSALMIGALFLFPGVRRGFA